MSTKRFRCCKKTQDGDFCTHCGNRRPEDGALEGITELRAYLESKHAAAIKTAETFRTKRSENEFATARFLMAEGWTRRAEQMARFLKAVDTLAKLAP